MDKVQVDKHELMALVERVMFTTSPNIVKYSTMERLLHDHYAAHRTLGEWFKMEVTEDDFLKVCGKLDSGLPR